MAVHAMPCHMELDKQWTDNLYACPKNRLEMNHPDEQRRVCFFFFFVVIVINTIAGQAGAIIVSLYH